MSLTAAVKYIVKDVNGNICTREGCINLSEDPNYTYTDDLGFRCISSSFKRNAERILRESLQERGEELIEIIEGRAYRGGLP